MGVAVLLTVGCAATETSLSPTRVAENVPMLSPNNPTSTPPVEHADPIGSPSSLTLTPSIESGVDGQSEQFGQCAPIFEESENAIINSGSLLFEEGTDIKATDFSTSATVLLQTGITSPILSPDGKKIAYGEDRTLHILDLETFEVTSIPFQEGWIAPTRWLDSQTIYLIGELLEKEHEGYRLTHYEVDLPTLETQAFVKEFDLPAYPLFEYRDIPGQGFVTSPVTDNGLIFYAAVFDPKEGHRILLQDTLNGKTLWQEDAGSGFLTPPDWRDDFERAAVVLMPNETRPEIQILSVNRDGNEIETLLILPSKYPNTAKTLEIRYIDWSPDGRYLHFRDLETFKIGRSYVLDTTMQTVFEICESGFHTGKWLSAELLVFVQENEEGEQFLKLLDVSTWQMQTLVTVPHYFEVSNVLGWSPLALGQ